MIKRIGVSEKAAEEEQKENGKPAYYSAEKTHWSEKLARNFALAGMAVLIITAVRNAELPSGQTVLTAVQDVIDTDWDERLGKISFVGNFVPDVVSVFFESPLTAEWTAPCFGAVDHAWSQDEPYVGYAGTDRRVFSIADGQVMSVAHGPDEEKILRVRQENGIEVMYYNLASVSVGEGDTVSVHTCIGEALPSGVIVEVRRAGRAVDPTASLSPRKEDAP